MSFRCGICGEVQPNRTPTNPVVVEKRSSVYTLRKKAHNNPGQRDKKDDSGGRGWEIVKEVSACKSCVSRIQESEEL